MRLMTIVFFVLGCFGLHAEKNRGKEFSLKVSKLDAQLASHLKEKWGLQVFLYGGNFEQGIESINLGYMLNRIVRVEEARNILLSVVEEYLNAVNQNISLRSYLIEYPFNVNRLTLIITFHPMPMRLYGSEFVTCVRFCNGEISYAADDDLKKPERYINIKRESYEEALKLRSGDHHD